MIHLTPCEMAIPLVHKTLCWDLGERQERIIYGKVKKHCFFKHSYLNVSL